MLTKGKRDLIIVPYDFTEQSDTALLHASKIALQSEDEVRLLHIINNTTIQSLKRIGKESIGINGALAEIAKQNQTINGIETTFHSIEGNIFNQISEYIKSSGANLAVMGTHGVHGLQYIIGANALKVITSSPVPFVVVQKRKINLEGYKRIVVPIDQNKKGKNKVAYAISLAKYFNSKLFIFEANESDAYSSQQIMRNSKMTTDYIEENNIPYEIVKEEGRGTFVKQLVRYSAHIDADLIVISSHHDNEGLMDFFFANSEVQILNNDPQIPVLCVNPVTFVTNLSI